MATLTVTTSSDIVDAGDGKLSLREAVAQANATAAADTIQFASALDGQTLTLTGGELVLRQDVNIDGDQNNDGVGVTLSGGDTQRILRTSGAGTDLTLQDLTLANGRVDGEASGGAILGEGGSITVVGCALHDNNSWGDGSGGAIFITDGGSLAIVDSSLVHNGTFYGDGGAVAATRAATVIIRGSILSDNSTSPSYGVGGAIRIDGGALTIEDSRIAGNSSAGGGGISMDDSLAIILRTTLDENHGRFQGGIQAGDSSLIIADSTIANNVSGYVNYSGSGAGIGQFGGDLLIRNSVITGNSDLLGDSPFGIGGVFISTNTDADIANSIIAGNFERTESEEGIEISRRSSDVVGAIMISDGHNIFGSDVAGNISGDRENVAPGLVFAALDPDTGGGALNGAGVVLPRNSITNPALSGADPLAASDFGQLGGTGRPLPAGSLPDIGSIEINQLLSTTASANNDVLTGNSSANTINGLAGADYIKGQGGNDTLRGNDGGDLLDGGAGNDKLYGDTGIDLVFYGGSTKVTVDLSLATDKAIRGSEVDTLYNVEGAIGSSKDDVFKGNEHDNLFQGGLGKDTATGGGGRDLYDFNAVPASRAGAATRDVITDFAHLVDKIDLMGIDADTGVAGNQAFRWVGTAALTGPGEVGFFTSGGITVIRASTDADAASEFEIQLTGIKTLTAVDFYL